MKYYAEFMYKSGDNEKRSSCGSDTVFILDGRSSFRSLLRDSLTRLEKLQVIHPDWKYFVIRKGKSLREDGVIVYDSEPELKIRK